MLYYIGNSLSLFLSLLRGSVFPLPVICGNVLQYVSDGGYYKTRTKVFPLD